MRYLTILGLLALCCILCTTPGVAQSIPPGSYQQTCTDINVVNGSTLAARCQDTSGNWQSTRLTNIQDCTGEIVNDNGSLRCGKDGYRNGYYGGGYQGGYNNGGLPPGDYVQTCRNIRNYGNRLDAECQKRDGGWRRTSLDLSNCSGGIVNNDGHLTCGGGGYGYNNGGNYSGGYQGGIPPGSYTQTCRDIRTHGDRLDAECQTRDGNWRHSSLDDFDRCRSAIANDDGHLVCGGR